MIWEITSKSDGGATITRAFVLASGVTWICCCGIMGTAPVSFMLVRARSSERDTSLASAFLR